VTGLVALTGAGVDELLAAGPDGRLGAARTRGDVTVETGGAAAWVLVEGGAGRLEVGDVAVPVAGRDDVFDRPGWSAVLPPGTGCRLAGHLRATIVWRASDRAGPPRVLDPGDVAEETRGDGPTARRVRTYVPEGPLIVGETLNEPGGWSSWPPHRHEQEELYLYRFDGPAGFGVHVSSDERGDRPVTVRDGDVVRIRGGWHPVVAAPGTTMYYLWALAGASDTLDPEVDARYG